MKQFHREKRCFNTGWLFCLGDNPSFASPELPEDGWRALTLPHDWSVDYPLREDYPTGGGGGYALAGVGWYRKHFNYDPAMEDCDVCLLFDGVYMDSTVFLNGQKVGGHGYGYSSFSVNVTEHLMKGENVLAVRVDNSHQPNSRWYSGSGIYRDVHLLVTHRVHLGKWGVFGYVSQLFLTEKIARLTIQATVENKTDELCNVGVRHTILDAEGSEVLTAGAAIQLPPHGSGMCVTAPSMNNPHLWSIDDPYLYSIHTVVECNGVELDQMDTPLGVRSATFDCDRGFLLNGERVKIKGMCVHHDCGLTGAVGFRETWLRRLRKLKDMGCNGIRCAHNPPSEDLLDLCDELGFVVMDEAFDEWLLTKDKINNYYSQQMAYGSSQFFSNDALEDLGTMVRRDRNHPSIVLWSIGNEIPEQGSLDGVQIAKMLQDLCHQLDPSRKVTSACDNIVAAPPSTTLREFENTLDVVGYNYVARWRERAETYYDEDRKLFPKRCVYGSEEPSAGGYRGEYKTPEDIDPRRYIRRDYRMATMNNEMLWRYVGSRDFVAGFFLWTGVDYLGETRWPAKGSCGAPIDMAGFEKDTFYYFRSLWNQKDVTLHILPHWNWEGDEGEFKQVIAYTNCEEVKLYINGRFVGRRGYDFPNVGALKAWNDKAKYTQPTTHDLHLSWDVPYEPGELRADGYIGGKLVKQEIVRTTGVSKTLKVVADAVDTHVGGVVHIDISTLDAAGLHVPDANGLVRVKVEGSGILKGMDSGYVEDRTLFASPERRMYNGYLMAMIYATAPGNIDVHIECENMERKTIHLTVKE